MFMSARAAVGSAYKMSTIQESELGPSPLERIEDSKHREGEPSAHARRSLSPQRGRNAGFDLVLPVDDSTDTQTALEHAIKMAKTYGARIVLMYITKQRTMPKEYADYARAERIRDFASTYFASLGESTISKLRRRIEEEGVECVSYPCAGSLADAIKACQHNVRVLMLILTLPRRSRRLALTGSGFRPKMISNLNVPVLLVPT